MYHEICPINHESSPGVVVLSTGVKWKLHRGQLQTADKMGKLCLNFSLMGVNHNYGPFLLYIMYNL